jgi:hypothetical protein
MVVMTGILKSQAKTDAGLHRFGGASQSADRLTMRIS